MVSETFAGITKPPRHSTHWDTYRKIVNISTRFITNLVPSVAAKNQNLTKATQNIVNDRFDLSTDVISIQRHCFFFRDIFLKEKSCPGYHTVPRCLLPVSHTVQNGGFEGKGVLVYGGDFVCTDDHDKRGSSAGIR